jgi:hypothetical protein
MSKIPTCTAPGGQQRGTGTGQLHSRKLQTKLGRNFANACFHNGFIHEIRSVATLRRIETCLKRKRYKRFDEIF